MQKYSKLIFYGLLVWFIPFMAAFLFFDASGNLRIEEMFFKSIMMLVGGAVGVTLMVDYIKDIKKNHVHESMVLGLVWLTISWVLDILILIPIDGMSQFEWFTQIGLRYIMIPIIAVGMGLLAQKIK